MTDDMNELIAAVGPGDAGRLIQRADGYVTTIKSGQVVMSGGETTGDLPGQLLRGAR